MTYTTSRRSFLTALGAGSLAIGISGCSVNAATASEIRFYQSKPEAIPYFRSVASDFGAQHPTFTVQHDATSSLSGSFARNSPPDLGCLNYNMEMSRFQERGALSDLSDINAEANISPAVADLVEQYPTYPGRVSVIPYSLMGAAVLYNKDIFAQHNLNVPKTYSEFIEVCDILVHAGVQPLYSTFADPWTIAQGVVDYSIGGAVDLVDFFDRLHALGDEAGPNASTSFSSELHEPFQKVLQVASYSQPGALSRTYGDGNVAFARGEAAMYFQGPWALTEIDVLNPNFTTGIFPLPMTEDPADNAVRVNIDLALWVPENAPNPDGARELLRYLIRPEIADSYNNANLGFGVRADAPEITDPRLQQIQPYIDQGRFYQGVSKAIPLTIPFENYCQGIIAGADVAETLHTLDADWSRLARRT